VAWLRAPSRTMYRVTPQRFSFPSSCWTISSRGPIHTKGDARMSPPEAPGMTLAISCARASASSVNSTCWTSASILSVRPAAPAAERIRSNVESSMAERQSTSWECPSAKVFPSPVTPTMSAAVAANRRRSGPFPPIRAGWDLGSASVPSGPPSSARWAHRKEKQGEAMTVLPRLLQAS
jgi:hypothetical protein